MSKLHGQQSEALHKALYGVHDDIYFKALKRIKEALLVLHELEGNQDFRQQARGYISNFEQLRDGLEGIGRGAADLRSRLIRENGCDGSCQS